MKNISDNPIFLGDYICLKYFKLTDKDSKPSGSLMNIHYWKQKYKNEKNINNSQLAGNTAAEGKQDSELIVNQLLNSQVIPLIKNDGQT